MMRCFSFLVLTLTLSTSGALGQEGDKAEFKLPEAYSKLTDSHAAELAKPLQAGLNALGEGREIRLIEIVKVLRSSGFSTQKTANDAEMERAGRDSDGTASGGSRGNRSGRGQGGSQAGGAQARFESMDGDGDGVLKGAEIGPRMLGTDRAKDNVVTLEEFTAAWEEMFGAGGRHGGGGSGRHGGAGGHHRGHGLGGEEQGGPRSARPVNTDAEFLLGLDRDRDRILSAQEIVVGIRADLVDNMRETVEKDSNQDGFVTLEEYAGEHMGRRTEFMFARRDTDGDQTLSPEEVVSQALIASKPRLLAIGACLCLAQQEVQVSIEQVERALMKVASQKDVLQLQLRETLRDSTAIERGQLYPTLYQVASSALAPARGSQRGRAASTN